MNNLIICIFLLLSPSASSWAQILSSIDKLPPDLVWQTNNDAPVYASPQAKRGGTFRLLIVDFPPTFRTVGPNANSSFVSHLRNNQLSLTSIHPQTGENIPELASHWAILDDNKTVFYKLNPAVRWSDGLPVTADDYLFTLTFMRSPHIIAPWYNNHYSKEITEVTKYDDYTIAVTLGHAKPREDVLMNASFSPTPKHFHQLDENWVQWANWRIAPVTGAYQISEFRKGRYIDFKRVANWWGSNQRYFKHRFNVDKVRIKVVRNNNIAWNMFLKGDLDSFGLVLPEYWHERSLAKKFQKGWIRKFWFYNETPQSSYGLFMNLGEELFADKRLRYAIAHALNIEKMNRTLMRGDYDRLPNFHTGVGDYTNPNIQARAFDLDKANVLLNEAGWGQYGNDGIRVKNGKRLSFKLSYSQSAHNPRLALLREEMRKAGIEMELQLLAGASSYRNIMEKKHQIAWMGWGAGLRPAYHQHFHSENANKPQTNNITNTADPKVDRLIERYRAADNKAERVSLAHQLQQEIHDIGAYIPTYMVPYTREGAWAYVRLPDDIAPKMASSLFDPMGLGTLWLDKKVKAAIKAKKTLPNQPIIDTRYRLGVTK